MMHFQQQEPPTYGGVSVEHPSIVEGIKNMTRRGYSLEHIVKLIGQPSEVVQRHMRDARKELEAEKEH